MNIKLTLSEQDIINYFIALNHEDKIAMLERLTEYTEYELVDSERLDYLEQRNLDFPG